MFAVVKFERGEIFNGTELARFDYEENAELEQRRLADLERRWAEAGYPTGRWYFVREVTDEGEE